MLIRALAKYLLKIPFYKGQLLFTEENRRRLRADCVSMVQITSHRTNPRVCFLVRCMGSHSAILSHPHPRSEHQETQNGLWIYAVKRRGYANTLRKRLTRKSPFPLGRPSGSQEFSSPCG